jgi:hypothetical protein
MSARTADVPGQRIPEWGDKVNPRSTTVAVLNHGSKSQISSSPVYHWRLPFHPVAGPFGGFLSLHSDDACGYNSGNKLPGGSAALRAVALGGFACF